MKAAVAIDLAVQLVTPVPDDWWPMVWAWIQELPDCNRDDDGPQTWEELRAARALSAEYGEQTFGVLADGVPVGFLSYAPINGHVAMTRGIVFTRDVHGTGIPRLAAHQMLARVWASGFRKVQAVYFVNNIRVAAFLRGLGAVEEGVLRDQAMQHGRLISAKLVAIFAPEDVCQRAV